MLYFYLGLSAIASLVIHAISFAWFQNNQDNNYHNIINLWLKDPLEKVILLDINQECPKDTNEFSLEFQYPGNSGLCNCIPNPQDSYSSQSSSNDSYNRLLQKNLVSCSTIKCQANYVSNEAVPPINSSNLDTFFYNSNKKVAQKLCVSKIGGYSFSQKAPLQKQCGSDEKYCDFKASSQGFDMDQGYCIPKDRQCQISSFALGNYAQNVVNQLPIVDITISTQNQMKAYNILQYSTVSEQDLLKWNNINYDPAYTNLLSNTYQIQINHMPRVKVRCREQLKQNLNVYLGPDGAYKVSLALLIFTTFSCTLNFFFFGIGDICDMSRCDKGGCKGYCESKRIQKSHSHLKNTMLIMKCILLILQVILNAVMIACYTNLIDYMGYMINDKCLDSYVADAIKYNDIISPGYYSEGLTFATLILSSVQLLFDQVFYQTIKTLILLIFCQIKFQICKQKPPVVIKLDTLTEQKLNNEEKKPDIEQNIQPQQNTQTLNQIILPIISTAVPKNPDNADDKSSSTVKDIFEECKSDSSEVKSVKNQTNKPADERESKQIKPIMIHQKHKAQNKKLSSSVDYENKKLKQAQEDKKDKQFQKQQKKLQKQQLKLKISQAKLLAQVQLNGQTNSFNQNTKFQEDVFDIQMLYDEQKEQKKQGLQKQQIKRASSIGQNKNKENKDSKDNCKKGNRSFEDIKVKQKNVQILSLDESIDSNQEEQKANPDFLSRQQQNKIKKQNQQSKSFEENLDDIFTDLNVYQKDQQNKFQQLNQMKNQIIYQNNQQTNYYSNTPVQEYNQQILFDDDQKGSDKFTQFKQKKSDEIIQPPEAPEPPEQSEKSHFSMIQFDDL
ncbi:transmembrane protein, putative (macronuclear) [Tetrahymena thermophila SB210]|uniref:Transmembrane protein, putative n=1 Tax=Tetrahymena thermophila (strain SB210) TaxID=312017 RepID=Q22U92_TETTS|nr:transmembrane protein, putative [Tetrahymena thermophila SB210]EAR88795.2 transmembrane protein, putative [Tetrahymena thermophila SB210]|eukprot:XP_001009040.2 transmembrane protein, putative [Tetrahymena thermophila SB210]